MKIEQRVDVSLRCRGEWRGVFCGASEGWGVSVFVWGGRLVAGGDAGSSAMMAEQGRGDGEPASKRRTRSMTWRVRLEQSAPAPCVDVVEIASSRKRA